MGSQDQGDWLMARMNWNFNNLLVRLMLFFLLFMQLVVVQVVSCSAQDGLRGPLLPSKEGRIVAQGLRIEDDGKHVRLDINLSHSVRASAFVLANPYRLIVDLPQVVFEGGSASGRAPNGSGLVQAFRYGRFAPRQSRLVVDLAGPAIVAEPKISEQRHGSRLAVSVRAISASEFAALQAAGLIGPPRGANESVASGRQRETMPSADKRPLIVIDPGHGGVDPGATAEGGVVEKKVVLDVARKLSKQLSAARKFRVLMTRDGDEFVSLKDRQTFSREHRAALFVSLHADAIADTEAENVGGATIYTLSGKASDEAARRLAEKENAVDLAAGLELGDSEEEDKVRGILVDLMRRETSSFSGRFRNTLLDKFKGRVRLSRAPARSAAFAVLKQAETPSVLVELGYVSNVHDRANLTSPKWQQKAAEGIAAAIEQYFSSR